MMGIKTFIGKIMHDTIKVYHGSVPDTAQTKLASRAENELLGLSPTALVIQIGNGYLVHGFSKPMGLGEMRNPSSVMYCKDESEIGSLLVADKVRSKINPITQGQTVPVTYGGNGLVGEAQHKPNW